MSSMIDVVFIQWVPLLEMFTCCVKLLFILSALGSFIASVFMVVTFVERKTDDEDRVFLISGIISASVVVIGVMFPILFLGIMILSLTLWGIYDKHI